MAFSLTGDAGCESGGGVNCTTNKKDAAGNIIAYKQSFLGFMLYNHWWFKKDRYGFTLGGGKINNPGRYLVLLPPINGATATTGTPYFTENPGDPFKAWDISGTYDYMPSQYLTFRWEFNHPSRQRALLERAGRSYAAGREQRQLRGDRSGMGAGSPEDRRSGNDGDPGEILRIRGRVCRSGGKTAG